MMFSFNRMDVEISKWQDLLQKFDSIRDLYKAAYDGKLSVEETYLFNQRVNMPLTK